jgi:ATP-dependent DNA helicase RecG
MEWQEYNAYMSHIPIDDITGIGPAMKKRLAYLGVKTANDLVWALPRAHDDRSDVLDISSVEPGSQVTIRAHIEKIAARRGRNRRTTIVEALATDITGSIKVVWFNQPYIAKNLQADDEVFLSGQVKKTKYGIALQSPEYEKVVDGRSTTHTARIVPQYDLTAGITQKQMRFFVKEALDHVLPVNDPLPAGTREANHLPGLSDALRTIHFPESNEAFYSARRRLDFDQLFVLQLAVAQMKDEMDEQSAPAIAFDLSAVKAFVKSLPFQLTGAQKKVAWAALQDMEAPHPMNRLVEGDVGSGKTVVAAIAMLNAARAGYQSSLMAPTEILAKQHYTGLSELLLAHDVTLALRTSKYAEGPDDADIVVGTHALIHDGVSFGNLGLAVVDEQHRFGVKQRKQLREQSGDDSTMPHLLSMTATPIPRSLALALYGDLALSIIDEMPPGRKPVETRVVPAVERRATEKKLRERIAAGEQIFVICPLIEDSDKLDVKSVTSEFERLETVFPDLRIDMLHGQMKSDEKEAIMNRMRDGEIDILVATSVIEVGVDVPNATVMVIEGSERFGLAQLHQFRGRVGRSDTQSYCFLFTSTRAHQDSARLKAMEETTNGFTLAEKDLELRGSGEVYGTQQSGVDEATLHAIAQPQLLAEVQVAAKKAVEDDIIQHSPELRALVNERLSAMHLE